MATQSPFSWAAQAFPDLAAQMAHQFSTSFQPPEWVVDEAVNRMVLFLNHVLMSEPEAMARLQAAVSKAPAQPTARPVAPAPKPAERPRFGIGSLISRMSGGSAEAAQPQRAQPPVTSYDDEAEPASDQDRMEIPAFLRRQAN